MATALGNYKEMSLPIDKKDHVFGMMNKFNQMRMQKRGCDLLIKVEGKEIHVHRNVMMVGSDYFNAMFTHDMEEKQSGVVEMKDISFRIFNKCVEFIYTGEISMVVEECEDLLFVASMLQLTSVCDNMSPFLKSRLKPSSFFATKRIADKFSLSNLRKACDDFALANLDQIVKEKEFHSLEKQYISFLVTNKKTTARKSEDSKMAIILQWIKADVENRSQHLVDLATLLDFRKISASCTKYLVNKEQLCYSSSELMRMFLLVSTSLSCVEEKPPSVSFESPEEKLLVVFDRSAKSLKAYNPTSMKWKKVHELHPSLLSSNYAAISIDDIVYIFVENKEVFKLNVQSSGSSWESIPNMKKNHHLPCSVVHDGAIYVAGSHSMERYHVSEMKWEEIDCSEVSNCHCCALAVHDNSIYTIGGYSNKDDLCVVNRFSPSSSSWSSVAPLPSPRHCSAAASYGDKIYVAGGFATGRLHEFLNFDPRVNTWTQLSLMSIGRHYFGLCIIASQLYAVGNYKRLCSIEMYDFEEGFWKTIFDPDDNMEIMAPATVAIELPDD